MSKYKRHEPSKPKPVEPEIMSSPSTPPLIDLEDTLPIPQLPLELTDEQVTDIDADFNERRQDVYEKPAGIQEIKSATEDMDAKERKLLDTLARNPEHDAEHSRLTHELAELNNRRRKLDGGWRAVEE